MTDFYMRPLDMKNGAVDLTHGAGGRATAQLIHDVFGRHFTNSWLDEGHDGALLPPMTRPSISPPASFLKRAFPSRTSTPSSPPWRKPAKRRASPS